MGCSINGNTDLCEGSTSGFGHLAVYPRVRAIVRRGYRSRGMEAVREINAGAAVMRQIRESQVSGTGVCSEA